MSVERERMEGEEREQVAAWAMDRGGFKLPCLVGHNNAHRDVFCTREGVRARGRWLTSGYPSAPNRRQCAPLSA